MSRVELVPLTLELGAPAVLTAPGGDPNSSTSMLYIPGSSLRGAVARGLVHAGKQELLPELVLSGRICYLNGYPVVNRIRSVPTPLSWRREKSGERIFDLAGFSGQAGEHGSDWPEEQLEPLAAQFVTLGTADCHEAPVKMSFIIHHQRQRQVGRATETEGAVFAFESLDAGQVFEPLIAIKGSKEERARLLQDVKHALGDEIVLGRSKNAGYGGKARLSWGNPRTRELVAAGGKITADVAAGGLIRAILTSDAVVRDPARGHLDPAALGQEIVMALEGRVEVVRARGNTGLAGGFNRKWGLELPQAPVLRAGSVLVLRALDKVRAEALAEVELEGLGERRAEGFGRVVFLEGLTTQVTVMPPPAETEPVELQGEPPETVTWLEHRLLETALERRALELARTMMRRIKRPPSPSLVARLRDPLRRGPAGVAVLEGWISAQGGLKPKARAQLRRCRVRGRGQEDLSLDAWLKQMVDDTTRPVEGALNLKLIAERNHLTTAGRALTVLRSKTRWTQWLVLDQALALVQIAAKQEGRDDSRA